MTLFLSADEVADLTDIRTGKDGKSREQRQLDALKQMKIPFYKSAIGRPKVSRAAIDGGVSSNVQETWEPALGR